MPTQQRVWRHNRCDLHQQPPAERHAHAGKRRHWSSVKRIREARAAAPSITIAVLIAMPPASATKAPSSLHVE
jgi:hypothetical protein